MFAVSTYGAVREALRRVNGAVGRWEAAETAYYRGDVGNDLLIAAECAIGPQTDNHREQVRKFDELMSLFGGLEEYAAGHPAVFQELLECLRQRTERPRW